MKTLEERKAILDTEILKEQGQGYSLRSKNDTYCQMYKKTGPNGCLGVFLLLLMILPGVLYFIFAGGEKLLTISVDEYGNVIKK